MIELRWVFKWVAAPEIGDGFSKLEKTLQWRGPAVQEEWKVDGPIPSDWSDWQDVPVVKENE